MASRTRAKLNNLNDRAREVGLTEMLDQDDLDALKAFYDFTCLKCGAKPAISPDHVVPLSKPNSHNTVENLQLLCENCNKQKRDDETDYRNGTICTRDYVNEWKTNAKGAQEHRTYTKHDWDEIEFEYVTTKKTYEELAQQFETHFNQLANKAAAEHWTEKRDNFTKKLLSDVEQITRETLAKKNYDILVEGVRMFDQAVKRWQYEGSKATLREIVELWKPLAAALGETTSRSATVDETDVDDDDIVKAAERIARRAERKAAGQDYSRSAPDEEGRGAGWTD